MKHALCLTAVLALGVITPVVSAQFLMVPESSNDNVMLFDAFDGTLIDSQFIDLSPHDAGTPVNAVVVGSEIWVTDQLRDKFTRWTLDGTTYLGEITGAIDNIRGFEVVGNTVYLTNSGTNNGAPGDGVVTIDVPSQSVTGFFATGSDAQGDPFDVLRFDNDKLLINDISSHPDGEDIDLFDLTGTYAETFHNSDGISGIDFPEQMTATSAGTVLAAGFSSPSGIYEYDAAGNQINYWDVGAIRGVHELGNGDILYSGGGGVYVLDRATGQSTLMIDVSGRFIEPIPEPTTLALLALAGLLLRRR